MVSKGLRMRYKAALSDRFFGCSAIKMNSFMISLILSPGHTAKRHILGVALPSGLAIILTGKSFLNLSRAWDTLCECFGTQAERFL